MTELEILNRNILALKELLRVSWHKLAFSQLRPEDLRETRSQMKKASTDLRLNLQLFEAEYTRRRKSLEGARHCASPVKEPPQPRLGTAAEAHTSFALGGSNKLA